MQMLHKDEHVYIEGGDTYQTVKSHKRETDGSVFQYGFGTSRKSGVLPRIMSKHQNIAS